MSLSQVSGCSGIYLKGFFCHLYIELLNSNLKQITHIFESLSLFFPSGMGAGDLNDTFSSSYLMTD